MAGIAASVIMAAAIGYLAGTKLNPNASANDTIVSNDTSPQIENFARTVAAYQKFYIRDTLIGTDNSPAVLDKLVSRLAIQTGMQINVPKLDGYEFMRAQHLSYDGMPLIQLVYLLSLIHI